MATFDQRSLESRLLICFALTFMSLAANAHSTRPPVSVVGAVYGSVEQGRTGYGWLNSSSEVEADALFRQECPKPDASGDVPICVPKDTALESAYKLAGQNFEAAFTNLALDNAYEQLILQQATINPAGNTWTPPSKCMASSDRAKQMKKDLEDIKSKNDVELNSHIEALANQITNKTPPPGTVLTPELRASIENLERKRLMAIKLRATRQAFDSNRMAEAFLLDKQLEQAQKRECPPAVGIPRKCMSIRRNRDRMRLSFPSVFAGGLAEQENITADNDRKSWEEKTFAVSIQGAWRCGTTPYTRFEASLYRLMGYNGAQDPIPGAGTGPGSGSGSGCATSDQDVAAIAQGKSTVDAAFLDDFGYTTIVSEAYNNTDFNEDGAYSYAYRAANLTLGIADPRMTTALANLSEAAKEMKEVQEMNAAISMSTFCQDRSNLSNIGRLQPQALRQAVLDQNNDRSREALARMMCKVGLMSYFQKDDQSLDCAGVSGDPNGSGGMQIDRTNYGFPFGSDSNYNIKTLPDGTMEVATKINYQFIYDPSISPGNPEYLGDAVIDAANRKTQAQQQAEFDAKITAWTQKSTAFLNSSATRMKDPKVTFKIEKCSGCAYHVTPKVDVSTCYYRVKPADFDTDFPGKVWDAHRCWYKNIGTPPIRTRMYDNWEDAGGFSIDMKDSTIMHETGHNLGLADEYVADYYPANLVGEGGGTANCNHSTMAGNSDHCNTLYKRHILEMVRPALVCPKP